MVILAGNMFYPTDVAVNTIEESVFVVEQLNHRISKWTYDSSLTPPNNFVFTLDAGRVTSITFMGGAGSGYSDDDVINISAPTLNIADPVNATAKVATVTGTAIATIIITNNGNGYDPNNLPTVDAPTTGTPAVLVAVVSTPWGTNGDGTTGKAGFITNGGPNDVFLDHPSNIVFDDEFGSNVILVTDTFHHRIRTIDTNNGDFIQSVGQGGNGSNTNDLYRPTGIAINDDNSIIAVADEFNHRCLTYTNANGTLSNPQPLDQPTPLRFNIPHGLTHNDATNLFSIGDSVEGVVSLYADSSMTFITQLGEPTASTVPADALFFPGSGHGDVSGIVTTQLFPSTRSARIKDLLAAPSIVNISTVTIPGTSEGTFFYPESITLFLDSKGFALVANTRNNRIEVFEVTTGPVLTFKNTFGSPVTVVS